MNALKFFLVFIAFIMLFALVDWFATVTAPVLGPIFVIAMLVGLVWLMVRLIKWGK
jgi:hypothetical protein